MKWITRFCWIFVGVLFIFSGLIKINDPAGTAIKLEEYFEVFGHDFGSFFLNFKPMSLVLAVILNVLEIVLGVALLMRWHLKTVLNFLLALIVFFTFLTFYSAYFNKVTDCGCFGDAIKLTPWESFTKDIVLLVMIVILLATKRYIPAPKNYAAGALVTGMATVFSLAVGMYAILHEPIIDFRAYKIGNNIPALMKPSEPLRYKYIMEKNGEEKEFEVYPTDTTWVYKQMVALNPEAGPKITDFSVWNDEGTFTEEVFTGNKLLILVHAVEKTDKDAYEEINKLVAGLQNAPVKTWALTSSSKQAFDVFRHEQNLAVPFYFTDATVLKTMMRSNPGIMLLKDGVVVGKWSRNDVPTAEEIKAKL
ncbi:DoxX family protein [Adhaeribacter sp. BT258]|uniref:DoxX family protein n=1 Tax=Adhaeribacter terrigena TaxID=2793070 RepID=A0ABS1C1P0_9BACT|nr:BT_3928 family protein [Adhaeribacter terrigena]MBK0403302.1 DoxX family protein [Adhaeribacter terrigena]